MKIHRECFEGANLQCEPRYRMFGNFVTRPSEQVRFTRGCSRELSAEGALVPVEPTLPE